VARSGFRQCIQSLRDAGVEVTQGAQTFLHAQVPAVAEALAALRASSVGWRMSRVEYWESPEDPDWQEAVVVFEADGLSALQKRELRRTACAALAGFVEAQGERAATVVAAIGLEI
jgi:hypothetical protein